jgi:undecaprenyl diphosphate synthase
VASGGLTLRHVLVVGGNSAEWAALDEPALNSRAERLARLCATHDVPWLTVRAYSSAAEGNSLERRHLVIDGCTAILDPYGDGRQRFVDAVRQLGPAVELTEASVAQALYAPADGEPDLVVILGPPTQLPPSLMWELAYAELVFLEVPWAEFGAEHLSTAIADFSGRRRRFGGLDPD